MENPYNVFLKEKYQFQAQRGDIIVREGEKKTKIDWDRKHFAEGFPNEMKEIYKTMEDDRNTLKNDIVSYQRATIDLIRECPDNITYWESGQGNFLRELVEMPLKCVDDFEYTELENEYIEIHKCFSKREYDKKDELNQLMVKYKKAVKSNKSNIEENEKRIHDFVLKYGLPYIETDGLRERKLTKQINDDLRAVFSQEDREELKIVPDDELYKKSITISLFMIIHDSFCLLLDMHRSLVKQNDIEPDKLFKKRINLFLQYLTWTEFFIGEDENKNICRSFACGYYIYMDYCQNRKSEDDYNSGIGEFLEIAVFISQIIGTKYGGDGRESDRKLVKILEDEFECIKFPKEDINHNYTELKEKFRSLEKVLKFLRDETILRYNSRGKFYEVEKFKDTVLDNGIVKKTVMNEVGQCLCEVLENILQDTVNEAFLQSQSIIHLNIREKKINVAFKLYPIEALKMEFVFNIIAGITYSQCKNCGKHFIPSHRNKVGCCGHKCTDAYLKRRKRGSVKPYKGREK